MKMTGYVSSVWPPAKCVHFIHQGQNSFGGCERLNLAKMSIFMGFLKI